MRIIDVHKDTRKTISIELWLNGKNVTQRTWRALIPNKPNRFGIGWADMYDITEGGHIAAPRVTRRKFGIVYYRQKA